MARVFIAYGGARVFVGVFWAWGGANVLVLVGCLIGVEEGGLGVLVGAGRRVYVAAGGGGAVGLPATAVVGLGVGRRVFLGVWVTVAVVVPVGVKVFGVTGVSVRVVGEAGSRVLVGVGVDEGITFVPTICRPYKMPTTTKPLMLRIKTVQSRPISQRG